MLHHSIFFFFFFNDTATTEIYTLSLHDALPISAGFLNAASSLQTAKPRTPTATKSTCRTGSSRSEEHTSELQSRLHLVCRLLLEKKKKKIVKQICHINKVNPLTTSSATRPLSSR